MSKFGSKEKCHKCGKTVYLMEKVTVEGKATQIFHNYCFRCSVCNKVVTLANYVSLEDQIFCKTHYLAELHARKSKAQNSGTSNGQDGQDEEQEQEEGEQQEQQDNGNSEPQEQTNEKSGYSDEDNDDEY
jgi:predicted nucleic acid binding AN1-type Zn finger protein